MEATAELIDVQPGDTIVREGKRYRVEQPAQVEATEKEVKKAATRLLKASCAGCGYTVRVTAKWANRALPVCPLCTEYDPLPTDTTQLILRKLVMLQLDAPEDAPEGE